mgnify:CR=1 FL=1
MMIARFALLIVASVLLVGCESAADREASDLHAVAVAWSAYHDANRGGPDNWDQLLAFSEQNPELNQNALKRVKEAGWELKWGKRIRDLMKPEHEPMEQGVMINVVIGTSPSGKRLYRDGLVQ